jgi:hypothetical protein
MKKQPESIIFLASSILILGIFLGISFNPVFAEINTDKLVYSKGELVEISGTIDLQTNQSVNLVEIKITNGDNTIIDEYIPLNNNSFSKYYDSNTWTSGEYKATISHNDTEEYTEFEIIGSSSNSNSNNTGNDNNSNTSQQESFSVSNTVPKSPINLKASVISSTQIDLAWSASEDDTSITGYKIEARINTDPNYSIVIANTNSVDTTYSHTGLISDTVYAYRISAINSAGESSPSSSVTVKTLNDSSIDLSSNTVKNSYVPTDVITKVLSPTSVELRWNPPTQTYGQTIQGYTIKQEIALNVYDEIITIPGSVTTYTLPDLNTDRTYTFVIIANYALGSSGVSEKAIVTLSTDYITNDETNPQESSSTQDNNDDSNTNQITIPTELKAIPVSQNAINLSWSEPLNATASINGYKIESKTGSESDYTTLVTSTGNAITTYLHTGLTAGVTYQYRVYAIYSDGESLPSNVVEAIISDNTVTTPSEQQQSTSTQPAKVTLNTDKTVYSFVDSIKISGMVNGTLTQNMPIGIKIISPDNAVVYVGNIPINNDSTFEITITPTQRQSPLWQSEGMFTIQATYNGGLVKATASFENNKSSVNGNTVTTTIPDNNTSTVTIPQSFPNQSTTSELDVLKNQNIALQDVNQQLQDENNQFKTQIDDLNKRIEQLDAIVQEQIKVMLETLGMLKPEN